MIIRRYPTDLPVQIDRAMLEDPRLSWSAKGLMAYLVSTNVTVLDVKEMRRACAMKGESEMIQSAVEELVKCGYASLV